MLFCRIKGINVTTFLENVSNWQQKADHNEIKYYRPPAELKQILSGQYPLILGRKGTGKSALLNYIEEEHKKDHLFVRIEFNPVRLRGWGSDESGNKLSPEHYEVLWSAFIFQTICREAVTRDFIKGRLKDEISIRHAVDTHSSVMKSFRKTIQTVKRLKVSFDGIEIENGAAPRELPKYPKSEDWLNFTQTCRTDAMRVSERSKYKIIVLCDEIDLHAHQTDRLKAQDYLNCVGGLLRSAAKISIGKGQETSIQPIVALRSDIFAMLNQPELNAWNGKTLELFGSDSYLRDVLSYRISKAIPGNKEELSFSKAWAAAFYDDSQVNSDDELSRFESIQDRTLNRTRDFVEYMRLAANYQLNRKDSKSTRLTAQSFIDSYFDFSKFFLNEFKDEMIFKYEFGRHIIEALRYLYQSDPSRQNFLMTDFTKALTEQGVSESDLHLRDLVRDLYHTSALGYQVKRENGTWTSSTFKHLEPMAQLPAQFWDAHTAFVLHRGFRRALAT